ncbi:hypothetical protein AVEN_58926-1 [Araneus ventricosus]|uniref:Uncharacterized protein n=1 Tax=Araneus ventricosus TaxID=182803 RepID=A0A4Y2EQK6_ARAVE|nr:hypothetical protein AVEN_58926-1 [Araneus ventricosus]
MTVSMEQLRARPAESCARTFALATTPLRSKRHRVTRSSNETCHHLSSKDHDWKILDQKHRMLIDQIDLLQGGREIPLNALN